MYVLYVYKNNKFILSNDFRTEEKAIEYADFLKENYIKLNAILKRRDDSHKFTFEICEVRV